MLCAGAAGDASGSDGGAEIRVGATGQGQALQGPTVRGALTVASHASRERTAGSLRRRVGGGFPRLVALAHLLDHKVRAFSHSPT